MGDVTGSLTDNLSYPIHTGRELDLMLAGTKPFAFFTDVVFEGEADDVDPDFQRHADAGLLVAQEVFERWGPALIRGRTALGTRIRLYALPAEAWRIPAWLLLRKALDRRSWNDELERFEGALLGYTDEQNDEWLALRKRGGVGWGVTTLFATTTDAMFGAILDLGRHAFPVGFIENAVFFSCDEAYVGRSADLKALLGTPRPRLIQFGLKVTFVTDRMGKGAEENGFGLYDLRAPTVLRDLNDALMTDIQDFESG